MSATYLTTKEASELTKASEKTIRRMIERGELKAFRFGRQIRIKPTDLDKAMRPVTPLASHVELEREILSGGAA